MHVSEIAERTGLSWRATAYHLAILARAREVDLEKGQRDRRAFPRQIPARQRAQIVVLRNAKAVEILRILLTDPGQGVVPLLSARTGCSGKVVRRHLVNLEEAGLVRCRGEWRPFYEVTRSAAPHVEALLRRAAGPGPAGNVRPGLVRRYGPPTSGLTSSVDSPAA